MGYCTAPPRSTSQVLSSDKEGDGSKDAASITGRQRRLTVPGVVHAVEEAGGPSREPAGGAPLVHRVLVWRRRRRRRWRSSVAVPVVCVGRRSGIHCLGIRPCALFMRARWSERQDGPGSALNDSQMQRSLDPIAMSLSQVFSFIFLFFCCQSVYQ